MIKKICTPSALIIALIIAQLILLVSSSLIDFTREYNVLVIVMMLIACTNAGFIFGLSMGDV